MLKAKQSRAERAEPSPDPWAWTSPVDKPVSPDWGEPLRFWQWYCQAFEAACWWREAGPPRLVRGFWERLSISPATRHLQHPDPRRVHDVILCLWQLYRLVTLNRQEEAKREVPLPPRDRARFRRRLRDPDLY